MNVACSRTVALHVHPAGVDDEPVWLSFVQSGMLVELLGANSRLQLGPDGRRLELDATEAHGLGLTPRDFEGDVALCLDTDGEFGWRCESIALSLRDSDGALRRVRTPAEATRWLP